MSSEFEWYKNDPDDKIWWLDEYDTVGILRFSFDKRKIYYLFQDYPEKLTAEELRIFNAENPYWAEFFGQVKSEIPNK